MSRPRLLLADDDTIVAEGVKKLLEPEFELVGTAKDGRELVTLAIRLRPDIALLDITMPLLNGIDAARQLREKLPDTRVVFLTMHADLAYVHDAFLAGASGYVLKQGEVKELVHAIREVLDGRQYVTPLAGREVLDGHQLEKSVGVLTVREREVLQLVAEGDTLKEAAAILQIAPKTVAFHKSNIMRKLGVRSTAELTKYAIRHAIAGAQ